MKAISFYTTVGLLAAVITLGVVLIPFTRSRPSGPSLVTTTKLGAVVSGLNAYYKEFGVIETNAAALEGMNPHRICFVSPGVPSPWLDGWGNRLIIRTGNACNVLDVVSPGRDGKLGTKDDIAVSSELTR